MYLSSSQFKTNRPTPCLLTPLNCGVLIQLVAKEKGGRNPRSSCGFCVATAGLFPKQVSLKRQLSITQHSFLLILWLHVPKKGNSMQTVCPLLSPMLSMHKQILALVGTWTTSSYRSGEGSIMSSILDKDLTLGRRTLKHSIIFSRALLQYLWNSGGILHFSLCVVLCINSQMKTEENEEIKYSEDNSYSFCTYSHSDIVLKCISNPKASLQMCHFFDLEFKLNFRLCSAPYIFLFNLCL